MEATTSTAPFTEEFEKSRITVKDLMERSSWEQRSGISISQQAVINVSNERQFGHISACVSGIKELLSSSFKLHKPSENGESDLVVDPWDVVLAELSFLFNSPMIVALVKDRAGHRESNCFVRTNITNEECLRIRGKRRGRPTKESSSDEHMRHQLIPQGVIDQLDNFYELHANPSGNSEAQPLAQLMSQDNFSNHNFIKESFSKAREDYEKLLDKLNQSDVSDDDKREHYEAASIVNPQLLSINGVVVLALYHVPLAKSGHHFVGTVEIFLPEEVPSNIKPLDADLLGSLALLLSFSLNQLNLNDFDSYPEAPTVPVSRMPSFREYSKDLKNYVSAWRRDRAMYMTTESSLPDIFDDLYLQLKRYFPRYCYKPDKISIAFLVSQKPSHLAAVGRYYFPPVFIREKIKLDETPETTDEALLALSFSESKNKQETLQGVPLDLGLLGYITETFFPTNSISPDGNFHKDARVQSYKSSQLEQEQTLFSSTNEDLKQVVEIPLVMFEEVDGDEKTTIYPTSLIVFLSGANAQPLPSRCLHHIYASAYHARYALAKAFEAEVRREEQVNRVSTVVHDVDRMCRPLAGSIADLSRSVTGNLDEVNNVVSNCDIEKNTIHADVLKDTLQFAQWVANDRATDRPKEEEWFEGQISEAIRKFQIMFSQTWSKENWLGWEALGTMEILPHALPPTYTEESNFSFPQGALYRILWNLAANAERKYRDLPAYDAAGSRPSITCTLKSFNSENNEVTAIFRTTFPHIDMYDPELMFCRVEQTECRREERSSCKASHQNNSNTSDEQDCDLLCSCGPWKHAEIFNSENTLLERQGLRSCRRAIEKWCELMETQPSHPSLHIIKAGRPVIIQFEAPLRLIS